MQQILSQKLEKENYDGYDMGNECQKKENSEVFLIISQKENGPLENQETDGRY